MSRYLQHPLAGEVPPVHPEVLGQHHGAGPHVRPVVRVQLLKHTGRSDGKAGPAPPRIPPGRYFPCAPVRYCEDARCREAGPRSAAPPHVCPPGPGRYLGDAQR